MVGFARSSRGFASRSQPKVAGGTTAAVFGTTLPRGWVSEAAPSPAPSWFRRFSPFTTYSPAGVVLVASLPSYQAEKSLDGEQQEEENYGQTKVCDIFLQRGGWQAFFCIGLILAANIIQDFDQLIKEHVELSFMVPLIIGHGGNSGAQTSSSITRALALKQVCPKSAAAVITKEAYAGCMMGGALGAAVLVFTLTTGCFSPQVGLVVAISLPVISLWANTLGAALTLSSAQLNLDPCLTSGPLVTTIVDTTGLLIYFGIAEAVLSQSSLLPSIVGQTAVMAVL